MLKATTKILYATTEYGNLPLQVRKNKYSYNVVMVQVIRGTYIYKKSLGRSLNILLGI